MFGSATVHPFETPNESLQHSHINKVDLDLLIIVDDTCIDAQNSLIKQATDIKSEFGERTHMKTILLGSLLDTKGAKDLIKCEKALFLMDARTTFGEHLIRKWVNGVEGIDG